ncbi:YEATS domain-containing protein 4 isoform X1 [Oenanthe melanoleuca]|uniref:YEATS domain-containing protein 4 isoform X1 n=1 Tax=Oenanthe melanoleuca TaxID=2939378 RepID=UPI0024C187EA|nr:YEATS domain-containing protein 4 isoform X1 [Oenanthe melanoleuca]
MFKRMAEFGPDSGGRVKGVTIVKPIVYGNVARYFGKKREEDGHTHQWTVYVKPYRNEDMSAYVKKIQFKLHESYGNPLRVVTKPPYEITETGWGEFEIIIKIFFIDPNERPLEQAVLRLVGCFSLLLFLEGCFGACHVLPFQEVPEGVRYCSVPPLLLSLFGRGEVWAVCALPRPQARWSVAPWCCTEGSSPLPTLPFALQGWKSNPMEISVKSNSQPLWCFIFSGIEDKVTERTS